MDAVVTASAIALRELTVLRHRTRAVDDVSMTVGRERWFGIIGANGSGKTSLLRGLAGRLPCTMGSCRIDDRELCEKPAVRARSIGFMPPAEYLPGALTGRQLFSLIEPDPDIWLRAIGRIAEPLGLDRLLDMKIGDCSAGMKQRVAIGCAFASGRSLVILDEPFNWLDPVAALDLRKALRQCVDDGLTLLTALHDMITLTACDEGLLIGNGKVVSRLAPQDILDGRSSPFEFEASMIALLRNAA